MKTLLLETERRSFSVTDRIAVGDVQLVDVTNFKQLEGIVWDIYKGKIKFDFVVIDTLSQFVLRSRMQMMTEDAGDIGIWDNKEKVKMTQPGWGILSDAMVRLILVLRDSPTTTIFVAHESTREIAEEGIERRSPDLNPAILNPLLNNCDIILRLFRAGREGELNKEKYTKTTPLARLIEDGKCVAKASTVGRSVVAPEIVVDPTLEKLRRAVGGALPGMILIYGSQGSGKTTLACTGYTLKTEKETTKNG